MNNIISLKNLLYKFSSKNILLKDINLDVSKGDRIGIYGKNGAGKSTLFHLIMGLEKPDKGSVEIFDSERNKEADFAEVRRRIGLLFQNSDDQLFSPTVLEDVAFGPLNLGKSKDETIELVRQNLEIVKLEGYEKHITHNLSGGEKKRVALASVMAMQPELLLLDEPFSGMDHDSKVCIADLLENGNYSYLMIDHELSVLKRRCTRIYELKDGVLLEYH